MSQLILIVDDEEDMRDIVRTLLELNGFEAIEAASAEEMFDQISKNKLSLIILDIGLPESDGLTAMKELRLNHDIPIVLLTGKGDIIDKVVGLELGADDYITKPFHSHELIARVKTILRRTESASVRGASGITPDQEIFVFNKWQLNVNTQNLKNPNNEEVAITSHEFYILHALIKSAGRSLTREQLLDFLGNGKREYSPYDRSLDVMIAKLRKKLNDNPKQPRFIRTIRQSGYMFIAELSS